MLNRECPKGFHTLIDVDFYQLKYVPSVVHSGKVLLPPSMVLWIYFRYSEHATEILKNHGYIKSLNPSSSGAVSLPINFIIRHEEYLNEQEHFQEIIDKIKLIFSDELQVILFAKSDDDRISKLAELILTCFKTENAKYIET